MSIANDDDLDPVSGLTSASACIDLDVLDGSFIFKPVYTHQCFEKELIPGFAPFIADEQEAFDLARKQRKESENRNINIQDEEALSAPHQSFKQANNVSERIKICVKLDPSCRSSIISFDRMRLSMEAGTKSEENHNHSSQQSETLSGNKRKASTVSFNTEQRHPMEPMSENQIMKRLQRALPNCSRGDDTQRDDQTSNDIRGGYLSSPFGTEIHKCKRMVQKNEMEFIFCLADGKESGVNEYHCQVQRLALFFIENADEVDLTSDEGGGFWKVLYMFRKHEDSTDSESNDNDEHSSKYSFVGYMTLFCFYSPFKKPKPGIVLRICQALILPPYQSCGLGKHMMSAVYDYTKGKYDSLLDNSNGGDAGTGTGKGGGFSDIKSEIIEVNVEDPSPSFTRLRDRMDYQVLKDSFSTADTDDKNAMAPLLPEKYFKNEDVQSLQDSDAMTAAATAKITKAQVQIAYEIFKLSQILNIFGEGDKNGNIEKSYRLMVKKRLNHLHREEIGACTTKEDKKKKLSELYENVFNHYKSIVRRLE